MSLSSSTNPPSFVSGIFTIPPFHFSAVVRWRLVSNSIKRKRHELKSVPFDYLVAGVGFEPTTSGL